MNRIHHQLTVQTKFYESDRKCVKMDVIYLPGEGYYVPWNREFEVVYEDEKHCGIEYLLFDGLLEETPMGDRNKITRGMKDRVHNIRNTLMKPQALCVKGKFDIIVMNHESRGLQHNQSRRYCKWLLAGCPEAQNKGKCAVGWTQRTRRKWEEWTNLDTKTYFAYQEWARCMIRSKHEEVFVLIKVDPTLHTWIDRMINKPPKGRELFQVKYPCGKSAFHDLLLQIRSLPRNDGIDFGKAMKVFEVETKRRVVDVQVGGVDEQNSFRSSFQPWGVNKFLHLDMANSIQSYLDETSIQTHHDGERIVSDLATKNVTQLFHGASSYLVYASGLIDHYVNRLSDPNGGIHNSSGITEIYHQLRRKKFGTIRIDPFMKNNINLLRCILKTCLWIYTMVNGDIIIVNNSHADGVPPPTPFLEYVMRQEVDEVKKGFLLVWKVLYEMIFSYGAYHIYPTPYNDNPYLYPFYALFKVKELCRNKSKSKRGDGLTGGGSISARFNLLIHPLDAVYKVYRVFHASNITSSSPRAITCFDDLQSITLLYGSQNIWLCGKANDRAVTAGKKQNKTMHLDNLHIPFVDYIQSCTKIRNLKMCDLVNSREHRRLLANLTAYSSVMEIDGQRPMFFKYAHTLVLRKDRGEGFETCQDVMNLIHSDNFTKYCCTHLSSKVESERRDSYFSINVIFVDADNLASITSEDQVKMIVYRSNVSKFGEAPYHSNYILWLDDNNDSKIDRTKYIVLSKRLGLIHRRYVTHMHRMVLWHHTTRLFLPPSMFAQRSLHVVDGYLTDADREWLSHHEGKGTRIYTFHHRDRSYIIFPYFPKPSSKGCRDKFDGRMVYPRFSATYPKTTTNYFQILRPYVMNATEHFFKMILRNDARCSNLASYFKSQLGYLGDDLEKQFRACQLRLNNHNQSTWNMSYSNHAVDLKGDCVLLQSLAYMITIMDPDSVEYVDSVTGVHRFRNIDIMSPFEGYINQCTKSNVAEVVCRTDEGDEGFQVLIPNKKRKAPHHDLLYDDLQYTGKKNKK